MRHSPTSGALGRFLAAAVAGALSLQSFVPLAQAQAPAASTAKAPTKKEKDAARKAYSDGEKAYQAGDYAAAYENFKKANDIIPSAQAVYWQAKSLDAQGKAEEAISLYEAFLANPGTAATDKIDDATKRLADLKAKRVGELTIESTPPATVVIDGTAQPGETPMTVTLPPGVHKVTLSAAGYESKEVELEVKGGEASTQKLELTPLPQEPAAEPAPPPPPAAPAAPEPPPAPAEKRSLVPGYVTLGIAAVSAGAGTFFGIKALSAKSDFDDKPTSKSADDAERNALFADMLFGVAITLGVTGIVLLTSGDEAPAQTGKTDRAPKKPSMAVAPYVSPKGGGAAARVTF